MEFTCLSEAEGVNFPPSHILDVCGFRVLFDCPMDLSALTIFSPGPSYSNSMVDYENACRCCKTNVRLESNDVEGEKMIKPLDANSLICAEPRYRTVRNLLLWNVSFIDVVLISSPMGVLGLPFLTRNKDFPAKVYATEAAARIGQLMMEDLVAMHKEFRQFYGPEDSVASQWMKWDKLELLPLELRKIVCGEDGTKFGNWMPLYSAADVKACMLKVESLKHAEQVCYNGILLIKAFSSGLEIGSCNWNISGPKGSIAYISNAVFSSATAMSFDHKVVEGSDVVICSNFSRCNGLEKFDNETNSSGTTDSHISNSSYLSFAIKILSDSGMNLELRTILEDSQENLEEMEKLDFICSCSMDSIKAGGSVLIPIGHLGVILQLLERFSLHTVSENVKVPIFVISSVAEELMSFTNIIPEWLCQQLQDRLYSGLPLFTHAEMLKEGRLHLFPAIHSPELLKIWQEPCIVFCPHWSLRLGPVVPLLRRWSGDKNSLLLLEEGIDPSLALLPFKPMEMKVLQCSFISELQLSKFLQLLKILQPKHVLFPEVLRHHIMSMEAYTYYSVNKKTLIPYTMEDSALDIEVELAHQLQYTTLKKQDTNVSVSRLKGDLMIEQGRYRLSLGNKRQEVPPLDRPLLHFGRVDSEGFVMELKKMGLSVTIEEVVGDDGAREASVVHVVEPGKAMVELRETQTLISTADENLALLISGAVSSFLDCI